MLKYIVGLFITITFCYTISAQDVTGTHDIQQGSEPNEFTIKTSISGLNGVDIARIKYFINNDHTYKASPNNALFSDRNEEYVKFYIMAVPPSGIINIEFGLILGDNEQHSFKVEFQYSKNEEKQTINLPEISFSGSQAVAVVEPTPPPVVEEEPVVEVTESTPVEEELVAETPEPTPPVVEEEPVVETPESTPPPVVEDDPVVEVTEPAPVEEEPVVETLAPTPSPVVEEPIVEIPTPPNGSNRVSTKYTVQLLSLMEFSEARLKIYCRQHHLSVSDVQKKRVGEWMKITYGEANSIQEATAIKEKLANSNGITESFVTQIK